MMMPAGYLLELGCNAHIGFDLFSFRFFFESTRVWRDMKIGQGLYTKLASCLIYARAFIEYVCGCVLFQDVTVREIRGI